MKEWIKYGLFILMALAIVFINQDLKGAELQVEQLGAAQIAWADNVSENQANISALQAYVAITDDHGRPMPLSQLAGYVDNMLPIVDTVMGAVAYERNMLQAQIDVLNMRFVTPDGEAPVVSAPEVNDDQECAENVFSGDWIIFVPHQTDTYLEMEVDVNCNFAYGTFFLNEDHNFTLTGLVTETDGRFWNCNLHDTNSGTENPLDFDCELWIPADSHSLFYGRYLSPGGWRPFCGAREAEFVPYFACMGDN